MSVLDRDAAARAQPGLLAELEADPATRVLLARAGQLALADGALGFCEPAAAPAGRRVYLGRLVRAAAGLPAGTPLELRLLDAETEPVGAELSLDARRAVHELDPDALEIARTALALGNWLESHRHCPACAAALEPAQSGWALECPGCGRQVFPRLDPAVIVLVTDDADRVLLGSNALWEARRFSLLAGFVEPGESLEQAVRREVFEESGVRVGDVRYLASQSWPFPASLMLGFAATAADAHTVADGEEILELRWFSRAELAEADVLLPGPASLAHQLLRDWYGEPLPERQ